MLESGFTRFTAITRQGFEWCSYSTEVGARRIYMGCGEGCKLLAKSQMSLLYPRFLDEDLSSYRLRIEWHRDHVHLM